VPTIPRNTRREKSSLTPVRALSKISLESRLVLVRQALESTNRRADLVPLLEVASDLIRPTGTGGSRRFRVPFLWPHKVDVEGAKLDLCCSILANWSIAPEAVQNRFLAASPEVLSRAVRRSTKKDPVSAAEWLCEHTEMATGGVLEDLILCPHRDAASLAAGLLAGQIVAALGLEDDSFVGSRLGGLARGLDGDVQDLEALVEQVAALAGRFDEHHQRDIMTIAVLLAEGPGLGASGALGRISKLMDEEHPATTGMRAALRRGTAPFMRSRAWRWLGAEAVRLAAIDRVSRATSVAEHEVVLRAGHLLLRPVRAKSLGVVKVRARGGAKTGFGAEPAGGEALPTLSQRRDLSPGARRWLVDLAAAVKTPEPMAAQLRGAGLTDPSPWVRWAHQRQATASERADYVFDADVRVARSAAIARSPAGGRAWMRWPLKRPDQFRLRLTGRMTSSPHEQVRSVARGDARRMNPFLVHRAESRLAARQWFKADRAGFVAAIRARIEQGSEQERVDSIRLARMLGIGLAFEPVLLEIAADDSASCRAAATAVAALGDIETPTARAGVDAALEAADVRVRANAVEACVRHVPRLHDLADADTEVYGSLIELKGDEHHRVRANALRALIEGSGVGRGGRVLDPSGVDGLSGMLHDDRGMHRLAGLWLAERTLVADGRERLGGSWDGLCRKVASIAVEDEDDAVRTRALRCARRLLAEVKVRPGSAASSAGAIYG
jgi:hypothetical protein